MKTSYLERCVVALALAFFVFGWQGMTARVFAQTSNTGTVTGVVKDEKGGLVPGASVKLVNVGTNAERTAVTSADGNYEIPNSSPATIDSKSRRRVFPSTCRNRSWFKCCNGPPRTPI